MRATCKILQFPRHCRAVARNGTNKLEVVSHPAEHHIMYSWQMRNLFATYSCTMDDMTWTTRMMYMPNYVVKDWLLFHNDGRVAANSCGWKVGGRGAYTYVY